MLRVKNIRWLFDRFVLLKDWTKLVRLYVWWILYSLELIILSVNEIKMSTLTLTNLLIFLFSFLLFSNTIYYIFSYAGVLTIFYVTAVITAEYYTGSYTKGPVIVYDTNWIRVRALLWVTLYNLLCKTKRVYSFLYDSLCKTLRVYSFFMIH